MYFKLSRKNPDFGFFRSSNFACLCESWPLKAHGDHPSLLVWWSSWLCQRKTTIYHTVVGHCPYFDHTSWSEIKKWQSKCSWNGKGIVIFPKYCKHSNELLKLRKEEGIGWNRQSHKWEKQNSLCHKWLEREFYPFLILCQNIYLRLSSRCLKYLGYITLGKGCHNWTRYGGITFGNEQRETQQKRSQ